MKDTVREIIQRLVDLAQKLKAENKDLKEQINLINSEKMALISDLKQSLDEKQAALVEKNQAEANAASALENDAEQEAQLKQMLFEISTKQAALDEQMRIVDDLKKYQALSDIEQEEFVSVISQVLKEIE
jgi:hypothetical protein